MVEENWSLKEKQFLIGAKNFVSIFLGERPSPEFIATPYFPFVSYYRGF